MQLKTIPEDFIVVELANHKLSDVGPYLLVEMTKRNLSTERALSAIADFFGVPRRFLGYAGSKDARAITKQYVTIKANDVERVKKFSNNQIALRFIGFVREPLGLGHLEQNRFEIVVRNIKDETVHPLSLIPNYFDEQRFSKANATIGKHLIKSEYGEAIRTILTTGCDVEDKINDYLREKPNDFISALRFVPKHILLMYVHAYQSLLFNEILTRYIRENDAAAVDVDGAVPIVVPTIAIKNAAIPIFGFGTEEHPLFGAWYEEILAREGVQPRDFVIRSLPFLTVEGGERDAFFEIKDLTIADVEDDDVCIGFKKQRLTFTLPKSCYATMVIKCLYRVGRLNGEKTVE